MASSWVVDGSPSRRRRLADRRQRVADNIAEALSAAGVEYVFGLPGGPIAPLNDALLETPVRVITTKHENTALFAAAGYARATGKIGVALVTSGPGVLNAMTGLASAYCDNIPLLLLVGEVPREFQGRGALQDGSVHHLGVLPMTRNISKLAFELPHGNAAAPALRRAMSTAMSGRPGPVVVTTPMDVLSASTSVPEIAHAVDTQFDVDAGVVSRAYRAMKLSKRGVIFAGSGVRAGNAPTALLEAAVRLQWPVMTTPKAKGVFPESHPLSLGVFGMGGHPSTTDYLSTGIETVLAVGTSLGDLATNGWSDLVQPTREFIHVDIDASQIGRHYPANIAISASASAFLTAIASRAVELARPSKTFGLIRHEDPRHRGEGAEGRITPQRAVWEIQQCLPKDTIYAVDSGEHYFFATHYLEIDRPDSYMVMTGLGSMGSGIGASLGLQTGHRDRPVAVICGDGGFAMMAAEVATAAANNLPICFVVLNDNRLGMVELGHTALYGRTPEFSTGPIDIPAAARAMGAHSLQINSPGQIEGALLKSADRPTVIDVRIDREERMPKNGRFASLGRITSSTDLDSAEA